MSSILPKQKLMSEVPDSSTTTAAEDASLSVAPEVEDSRAPEADPTPTSPGSRTPKPAEAEEKRDTREHINLVFIGHVDAGKSTLSGQILLSTGQVDKRTIEKYEKEAKEKNRESWYLAYVMDQSEEERARGKTVECGRAEFSTNKKRVTLLDAPGHKGYVPAMIQGAAQADIGALVISARAGEFEAGYMRGGQTLEHITLARTLGIAKMIVLVNKMDDTTVKWSEERYKDIKTKLEKTLQGEGYKKDDYTFIPVSGFSGANVKDRMKPGTCSWYSGDSFFEAIDGLAPFPRPNDKALRLPVSARYKDRVLFAIGKVESGTIKVDDELVVVPNMKKCTVVGIALGDETEVSSAGSGENVIVRLKGIEEDELLPGFVLSPASAPGMRTQLVEAQMVVLDLTDSSIPLISAGFECILHAHTMTSDVKVKAITQAFDKKGKPLAVVPKFVMSKQMCVVRLELPETAALEKFAEFPQLGRFTLRDKTLTIAIGKILRLKPA